MDTNKVIKAIFNKDNFKNNWYPYILVITFLIVIILQIIVGSLEIVLIIYLYLFIVYALMKLIR